MGLVPCLAVSSLCILLDMFVAEALRKSLVAVAPASSVARNAALELIAAAEMCACGFELAIIADHYGVFVYAVFLFLLTIWWSEHWAVASVSACPYLHLEEAIHGNMRPVEAVARTVAATVGGLAVFWWVQLLWKMEFSETHVGRPHASAFGKCTADLQIPPVYGATVEAVATFLCRLASKSLSESEPEYATAIDSFIGTSLVVAAFNYSGGYFNPVLATSLKFGCRGHTAIEHIAVYWIGASLGAVASIYVYPLLRGKFSPAGSALSSGSSGSAGSSPSPSFAAVAAAAAHRMDKKSE